MASVGSLLSEEHFMCSVCMDVFTDPVTTPCGHNYCNTCIARHWDNGGASTRCPLCNKAFCKRPELSVNRVLAELADRFRRHRWKEAYERKTEAEVQEMVRERREKIQEVRRSAELSREDADREVADSVRGFAALIDCVERSRAELVAAIEEKQETTEKQAEGFVNELQLEIVQLEERSSELRQLAHAEDRLSRLPQNSPSSSIVDDDAPPPVKDWTNVNIRPPSHVATVRTAVARLETALGQEVRKLRDAELTRIRRRHAVDVTLDADTANLYLAVSEDGKRVSFGEKRCDLPDNAGRFSRCPNVLAKQGFSSGRFYYEVQVKEKTSWTVGVVRGSVHRKRSGKLIPSHGYWSIGLRKGNQYWAGDNLAVLLPVREKVQAVGVFVDYDAGLVSFYVVETRGHLYSFTGCAFLEKIYPYFNPYPNLDGKNSAPLVISPVSHTD